MTTPEKDSKTKNDLENKLVFSNALGGYILDVPEELKDKILVNHFDGHGQNGGLAKMGSGCGCSEGHSGAKMDPCANICSGGQMICKQCGWAKKRYLHGERRVDEWNRVRTNRRHVHPGNRDFEDGAGREEQGLAETGESGGFDDAIGERKQSIKGHAQVFRSQLPEPVPEQPEHDRRFEAGEPELEKQIR